MFNRLTIFAQSLARMLTGLEEWELDVLDGERACERLTQLN